MNRPLLAITMGDPAGIGPEVIVKALQHEKIWQVSRPVVIGDARWLNEAARLVGTARPVRAVSLHDWAEVGTRATIDVLDLANVPDGFARGQASAAGGRAAYAYIERAVQLALNRQAEAIVTAPLNKEALHLAGKMYAGHTEILANLCGVKGTVMMLTSARLRVSHVSTHVSLREALTRITGERIVRVAQLTNAALVQMGIAAPRLAVAGLNPHAGESGLFGDEEEKIIAPAVAAAQRAWLNARGPFPPDTIFLRASQGEFDAVIAMYHDQGHIPMKLLGFFDGVNVTLGLPIIRTSVDHGTAFDIVGTGRANEQSMLAALWLAAQMAKGARPRDND